MCGIVGYINRTSPNSISEVIERMQSVQGHRGPDQQNVWVSEAIGLGAVRLSIRDLSEAGSQPMTSSDGRFVLVYNGELYNADELRDQLKSKGISFQSGSDTEVVLQMMMADREKAIEKFEGMFAFGFYDSQESKLILARDRSGIKTLHYYCDEDTFMFASEIKSIWKGLEKKGLEPDAQTFRDLFSLGYSYGSNTPFKGLKTLREAHWMELSTKSDSFAIKPYYDLFAGLTKQNWDSQSSRDSGQIEEELETQIRNSVHAHLVSDAPLGVICSGGVDSSLVAAMAAEKNPNLKLYHASIPGPSHEEPFARKVAEKIGASLHVQPVTRELFLKNWPYALFHNDFPSYHPSDVPLYLVCRLAREQGIKVLLSGEGADELFGGYEVNADLYKRMQWQKRFSCLPGRVRKWLNQLLEARLLSDQVGSTHYLGDICGMTSMGRLNRFIEGEIYFQGKGERFQFAQELNRRLNFLEGNTRTSTAYLLERMTGHLQTLLLRNDRMGMMASIETRVPYLSNGLLATWVSMPLKHKIQPEGHHQGLKYLLKNIAKRYLPASVVDRKKIGFAVPVAQFVKPDLTLFKDGFLTEVMSLPFEEFSWIQKDASAFYRLASLEIWGRLYFRNESPKALSDWVLEHC